MSPEDLEFKNKLIKSIKFSIAGSVALIFLCIALGCIVFFASDNPPVGFIFLGPLIIIVYRLFSSCARLKEVEAIGVK